MKTLKIKIETLNYDQIDVNDILVEKIVNANSATELSKHLREIDTSVIGTNNVLVSVREEFTESMIVAAMIVDKQGFEDNIDNISGSLFEKYSELQKIDDKSDSKLQ